MKPAVTHLNLAHIEQSLKSVQKGFDKINKQLDMARDPMTDTVINNMLSAFRYLDTLIDNSDELFKSAGLTDLLELNHRVLCGEDARKRKEFAKHIAATEEKFYAHIGWLKDWYRRHRNDSVHKRAAGVYIGILCQPQLFIEGNHRTGSLIAGLELMRAGEPPFVLDTKNAVAYFNPSTVIKLSDRRRYRDTLFKMPGIKKRFGKFLEKNARSDYLLQAQ